MFSDWTYVALIPVLPLLSFIILGFLQSKLSDKVGAFIGITAMFISTVLAYYCAYNYFFVSGNVEGAYRPVTAFSFTWLHITSELAINFGAMLDPVSVMMLIVITTVSLMVFIYSSGYMKGDRGYPRYFAFLSLFSFSMLSLVLATGIIQLYIFWELVGVSSFLLIGFFYDLPSAVSACKKAFIVTRFADFFFFIGILTLSWYSGTLDIQQLISVLTQPDSSALHEMTSISFMGVSLLSFALTLVFIGGAGKSAMFPLHIWLPDAMEGPTPVSALIHAATMVVAGVYLVARLFPVYSISAPDALTMISYVGAISAFLAAVIACTQFDIKRVLAYSTISQIAYMILALGVAGAGEEHQLGFMASQFHLFTHAMFKALLFLCSGMIIHALHTNDMRNMGELWNKLPFTHIAFLTGCLAIAGIPPFAGFFSKEEILTAAFQRDKFIYVLALTTAGLTSFYMFRLYFSIFHNGGTALRTYHKEPKEHSLAMMLPLVILGIGSVVTGFIPFGEFVTATGSQLPHHFHLDLAVVAVVVSLIGISVAAIIYFRQTSIPEKIISAIGNFHTFIYHKFYFDELYLFVTRRILFTFISRPFVWFDHNVIDGGVNGVADGTGMLSERTKGIQSGKVQDYLFVFALSAIGLVMVFIYMYSS